MAKQYNVNIIGNLINNDGVLSGFSASNYAKLNKSFQPGSASWEIVYKINTDNTPSGAIFGNTGFTYQNAPQVGINSNSKFQIYVPANGTQGGGHNIVDGATGTYTVLANTTYWIKLYFTGSEYAFDYSLDGETYINDYSYTSSTIMYQPNVTFNIGYNSWDVSSVDFFTGTIDLNESYIKVNGVTWWQGTQNITKIQLRHDTAANWTSVNPVLLEGEVGIETDTRKQKFGDGTTAWNSLPYDLGSTALQSITSSDVTTALGYIPVNKAGDTMTGNLNFTTASSNPNIRQITTLSDATLGTLPSVNYYNGFQTKDSQGNEFANVNCSYGTSGRIGSNFYVTRSDSGSTVSGSMGVYIDQGGTEAYAVINCPTTINNGLLSVSSSEITVGNLIHAKTEVATSKGTIPSSDCFQGILFEDSDSSHTTWQSNRLGACQMRLTSTGDTEVSLYAYRNVANSSSGAAQLRLVAPQTGDVYCTVPAPPSNSNSTNAATTAWVRTKINEAFSYNSSTGTLTLGL